MKEAHKNISALALILGILLSPFVIDWVRDSSALPSSKYLAADITYTCSNCSWTGNISEMK